MSHPTRPPVGLAEAARDFLAQKRIAIVGVSRNKSDFSRAILKKLSNRHDVVPVNPAASEIGGIACYPDLGSIPGGVGAVLVVTPASQAADVVRECAALGIPHVWLHRSLGVGSSSEEAVAIGRSAGLTVIQAGCPMMFAEPVDLAHRCARWCLSFTGRLPKTV